MCTSYNLQCVCVCVCVYEREGEGEGEGRGERGEGRGERGEGGREKVRGKVMEEGRGSEWGRRARDQWGGGLREMEEGRGSEWGRRAREKWGGGGVAGDGERDRQMEKSQRGRVEIVSMERL